MSDDEKKPFFSIGGVLEIARPELLFPIDDHRVQQAESPDEARTGPEFVFQTGVLQVCVLRANDPALVVGILRGIRVLENVRRDANRAVVARGHLNVRYARPRSNRFGALPPRFAFDAESVLICQLPKMTPEKSNPAVAGGGAGAVGVWAWARSPGTIAIAAATAIRRAERGVIEGGVSLLEELGQRGPGRCYRFRHSNPNLPANSSRAVHALVTAA